jgi:hypothetical protein
VIWVCMKTYSVMSDLSFCENVFCNESSQFVWKRLITEYVFIQTQITHYRIRFHTNWDDSLQNTFSHKLRPLITEYVFTQTETTVCVKSYSVMGGLSLCDNVFCNEWSVMRDLSLCENVFCNTHYRLRFHTNSDHSLQITFKYKFRSLITEYVFIQTQTTHYRIRFSVCVKTHSVMSDLNLCENVFCNEWSEFVWKLIM